MKPFYVEGINIDDVWFQLLSGIQDHGMRYKIDSGSYAGEYRLEYPFASGWMSNPHIRPLAPIMPESSPLPAPTDDNKIAEYFANYIMDPDLEPNEEYRYSSWINQDLGVGESPVDWIIRHFKERGYGNNHCFIQVGNPDSILSYDRPYSTEVDRGTTPCLRGLDFKIKDGKLITTAYFRSWDLFAGFPENCGGFVLLNEFLAEHLEGVEPGPLAFASAGLHCYSYQLDVVNARLGKRV